MRILYVVQEFSGPAGSWGSRSYEHPVRLVQGGHEVTLLCGSFYRGSKEDIDLAKENGIDIHQAPIVYSQRSSLIGRLSSISRYKSWATDFGKSLPRPDLVFASSGPLTMGEVGRVLARHHHVPFVFEVRDLLPECAISLGVLTNPLMIWYARRMTQRIYAGADHVIALSPGMKEGVMNWGVPEKKITVIPNCSDNKMFSRSDGRNSTRERLGWQHKLVCIHPGAMGDVNGLDYLLDCAAVLDGRGITDVLIAILGDGKHRKRLEERIESEGIRSAVIYNNVPHREMCDILSASDVGIVCIAPRPYLDANSANKFFDYLASGLPVVINYGGWQADVLSRAGAGFSVHPDRPDEMSQALIRLRDDRSLRESLGTAGRRLAVDEFDRDNLVALLEKTLCGVAARSRSRVPEERASAA